jgi:NADH dehydrogenase
MPTLPENLSDYVRRTLGNKGVEVMTSSRVIACDARGVELEHGRLDAGTVIWAAGVVASPAARWLNAEQDRAGRVLVNPDLTVPGHPNVFVIGDTAAVTDAKGTMLPGVAPVAKQQGQYVARALIARREGRTVEAFRYRDYGSLATIGRSRAVMQLGRFRISGFLAWVLWSIAHIYFLIGFRNRFIVALNWAWNYITFERGSRLITGLDAEPADKRQAPRTELHSKAG